MKRQLQQVLLWLWVKHAYNSTSIKELFGQKVEKSILLIRYSSDIKYEWNELEYKK